jgi:uncharacterized membrane protein YhaH (DUF805 family)
MDFGHLFFSFNGRINRLPYWIGSLLLVAVSMVLVFIALGSLATGPGFSAAVVIVALLAVALIWPGLAIAAKRLHDRNKSAWWLLVFYVLPGVLNSVGQGLGDFVVVFSLAGAAISIWALIELGFLRGTPGPNDYGPDPLSRGL